MYVNSRCTAIEINNEYTDSVGLCERSLKHANILLPYHLVQTIETSLPADDMQYSI